MTRKEAYESAIAVQDASNLLGVLRSFVAAMDAIKLECDSTDERNTHPIAVLYSSKIESLTHSGVGSAFNNAYERVEEEIENERKSNEVQQNLQQDGKASYIQSNP